MGPKQLKTSWQSEVFKPSKRGGAFKTKGRASSLDLAYTNKQKQSNSKKPAITVSIPKAVKFAQKDTSKKTCFTGRKTNGTTEFTWVNRETGDFLERLEKGETGVNRPDFKKNDTKKNVSKRGNFHFKNVLNAAVFDTDSNDFDCDFCD